MRKALLIASLVFLGGCLDYEEVITLAADGSGSVRVDATVDLTFAEKLMALQVPPGEKAPEDMDDPYKMMISKEEIAKNVQGVDGVTIKEIFVDDEKVGPKRKIKLLIDFKTLDGLRKTTGFQYRELAFAEKNGDIEATYKIDARFLKDLGLLFAGEDPKDATELEKKMRKVVEGATAEAGARFVIHLPAKPSATSGKRVEADANAVSLELAKKDAKAHAALVKEPLVLTATFPRKDCEVLLKKPEHKEERKLPPPAKKDGD